MLKLSNVWTQDRVLRLLSEETVPENFTIIIPDDDRKGWRKLVQDAAVRKEHIILESPWNSETSTEIIYSRKREGYNLIMYQLYLNSPDE